VDAEHYRDAHTGVPSACAERNRGAIHETLASVAKRHGVHFSEVPPVIRKGGVGVAEEAMLAKIPDAALLTEIERRDLLSAR